MTTAKPFPSLTSCRIYQSGKPHSVPPPVIPPSPLREYKCEAANLLPPGSRSVCKALRFASGEEADKHLIRAHLQRCITCLFCGEKLSLIEDILEHFKQKIACGERLIGSVETVQLALQTSTMTGKLGTATTRRPNVNTSTEPHSKSETKTVEPKRTFRLGKALLDNRTRNAQKLVSKVRAANGDTELESDEGSESLRHHVRAQVQADTIEEWFWYENRNTYYSRIPDFPGKLKWLRKGGPFAPYIKIARPYCQYKSCLNFILKSLAYSLFLLNAYNNVIDWPNHMFYEVYSLNIGIDETMTRRMINSECGYFPPTVALAIYFWQSQRKTTPKTYGC